MKKLTSLLLVLVMLASVLALSACSGNGFDYRNEDLTKFVTLADFKNEKLKADVAKLAEIIEVADVEKEIDEALKAAFAYYKKITDENEEVNLGDMVGITYKGVLVSTLESAGFTKDGKNANGSALTEEQVKNLSGFSGGEAKTAVNYLVGMGAYTASSGTYSKYIDDLDQGLIGHKIGEKYAPIPCTFPEDYSSTDLKGKDVVFFTSFEYELQAEDPRDIDYGDLIAITYMIELDEGSIQWKEPYEKENGALPTEPVKTVLLLTDDDLFYSWIKVNFNKLDAADRYGKEFSGTADRNLVIDVDVPDEETGETQPGKKDETVTLKYTMTVHKLANTRCFTAADVKDGTLPYNDATAEGETEGEPSAQADDHDHDHDHDHEEEDTDDVDDCLADYLDIDTKEYPTYDEYVEGLREDMQLARDVQIAANKYQAAFDALVAASTLASFDTDETMKMLKQKYIDEIYGNIEYLARNVEASGYASLYMQIAGVSSVEEYAMTVYGYTKANIAKQLPIDAEEYVSGRMVFWQLIKENPSLELTDEEYTAGLENYKELNGDTFMEDYGYTEEAVREALTWDKVAKWLSDNYVEFNYKAAVED